jgi:H+/Na+-translocating ferredoxin:NAD+ oxidoreductase subunit G
VDKVKEKSSIFKDAIVLFAITLIAGLALSLVYEVTKPIIDERELEAKTEAYQTVYSEASSFTEDESLAADAESAAEDLLAPNGFSNIQIDEVFIAVDSGDNPIGHVLSVSTGEGYGGTITISLGYSLDGTVKGLEFLVFNESAGIGTRALEPEFKDQYVDKQVTDFVATKSGASADNEIDVISGATVTTDAITDAVNAGLLFLNEVASGNN